MMSIGIGELLILVLVVVFGLGGTAVWIWGLVDCVRFEPSEGNTKVVWVLVIAVLGWVGALLYFVIRRPERERLRASRAEAPRP